MLMRRKQKYNGGLTIMHVTRKRDWQKKGALILKKIMETRVHWG